MAWVALTCPQCSAPLPRVAIWRSVKCPACGSLITRTEEVVNQKRGQVVSYDELFQVVKSGRNRDNVRKHISTIREAFRELDEDLDCIENIPMRGFRWSGQTSGNAFKSE